MDKWQFYTKFEVSQQLTSVLLKLLEGEIARPLDKLLFIEPSAGYGCFYDSVRQAGGKIIGFDIEPKHEDITKADFLAIERIRPRWAKKNSVIIGNPPFGKRARLAIDFFNKSAEFANTIGFIVPKQFEKYSVHSKLHPSFRLIHSETLAPESFYIEGWKSYALNSVFQLWTRHKSLKPDLRIKTPPKTKHADFKMWQYNSTPQALKVFSEDFDFAVLRQGFGNYRLKYFDEQDCDRRKQWMLIKAKNKDIYERLLAIDFEKLSYGNTIIPGFWKADLVSHYQKTYD